MVDVSKGNWAVWGVAALAGVFVAVGIGLALIQLDSTPPDFFAFRGFDAVAAIFYLTVALLILQRQPSHALGGVFLGVGSFSAFFWMMSQYGLAAELGGTEWPGGAYAAWFQAWGWVFLVVPILSFIPALFPNGRLENRFDRGLFGMGAIAAVAGYLAFGTAPGLLSDQAAYASNPMPIRFLPHEALEAAAGLLLATIALWGAAALIRTYRNGGEVERLQVKWLMSAITFLGLSFAFVMVMLLLAPDTTEDNLQFFETVVTLGILSIPVSIGFAITRYRLYDIEVVINRAIVYGPLTALVAASYVGAVQLARLVFVASTGERSDSELLVATLIAAAVFWIIRARMIRVVDQHFKDPREPAKDLRALQVSLQQMTRIIEPTAVSRERLADYVLTSCVAAFDAQGGRIDFAKGRAPGAPIFVGTLEGAPATSIDIAHNGTSFGTLHLGTRASSKAYSERDVTPLAETAMALAEILSRRPAMSQSTRRGTVAKRPANPTGS